MGKNYLSDNEEQPRWQEMKRRDGACVRKDSNLGSPPAEKRKATEGFLSFYWSLGTTLPGHSKERYICKEHEKNKA